MNNNIYFILVLEVLITVFFKSIFCQVTKSEVYSLNDSHLSKSTQKYNIIMLIYTLGIFVLYTKVRLNYTPIIIIKYQGIWEN